MAFDPSRIFTSSSGKVAAILSIAAVLGVLAAFAVRIFGYQKKFPNARPGPPLMGSKNGAQADEKPNEEPNEGE
ncbi:MAG TPA: hypothetical protein ENI79_04570 [Rhodospirillales bacterium]|nr:hypothetical protein [Rhodospirillales bacterium]